MRTFSEFVALCLSVYVLNGAIWTTLVAGACTKINSCSCKNDDGTFIDLSPLAQQGGTPKFQDIDDQHGDDMFSWNPCNDFAEGTCSGVSVCQIRPAVPQNLYFSCGTQDSADFLEDDQGRTMLQYSADTAEGPSNTLRTTNIVLICDQSTDHSLIVKGEQGTLAIYDMELTSKYACPKTGPPPTSKPPPSSGSGSLSVGWILVIVFISIIALYLAVGFAFQIGVRKKRGVESIPNYEFWTGLPSTIRAGVMFTVQRGKGQSYDSI